MTDKFSRKAGVIILLAFIASVAIAIGIYSVNIFYINEHYHKQFNADSDVSLRKFPYPYRSAMTICSDIDRTETIDELINIQKFTNSGEMTNTGKGVGLYIGNSFFFYEVPASSISYFNNDPFVRETIKNFIKSGQIDVLHSYGKKSDFKRQDAIAALSELRDNNLMVDVWVDHTKSSDNFGNDVTLGHGDIIGSAGYHADVTIEYGIKFLWLGRVTMITGQSIPITLKTFTNIFDKDHPIYSILNMGKEFGKHILGILGSRKYAMHKTNDLVKIITLDDGQRAYEFMRFDNYWRGVGTGANCRNLAYSISKKSLDRLQENAGYMIVYTHLGMNSDCHQYICQETKSALRNLARKYADGHIFITSTSKLLNYYINNKYLNWSFEKKKGEIIIRIDNIEDPVFGSFIPSIKELDGMTFYVPDKNQVKIYLNDTKLLDIQRNAPDYTKRESVTILSRNRANWIGQNRPFYLKSMIDQEQTVPQEFVEIRK
jgi:hypothetical protein